MSFQKIVEAWYDGDVHVKTERATGGGFNSILRQSDIDGAVRRLHLRARPRTPGQWQAFAKSIQGKVIDISSFGGKEDIEDTIKKERRKRGIMAKEKKVEWVIKGYPEGVRKFRMRMSELTDKIRALPDVGQHGYHGVTQVKEGDDEKADELTVVLSFSKTTVESRSFDTISNGVEELIISIHPELKIRSYEKKE